MKSISITAVIIILVAIPACSDRGFEEYIKEGNKDVIADMLGDDLDPDTQDEAGHTMLYYAIQYNQPDIAVLLIRHKSSCTADGSVDDLRLYAAEKGCREITGEILQSGVTFRTEEDETEFLGLLVRNDWGGLLSDYYADHTPISFDRNKAFDLARELGSQTVMSYLAGKYRNEIPVYEYYLDPVNPDPAVEDLQFKASRYLDEEGWKAGINHINSDYGQGQNGMVLNDPDRFLEYVLDTYLAQPQEGYAEYGTALKNSYYWNLVHRLPPELPGISRAQWGSTKDDPGLQNYLAYFIHRIDRYDPRVIMMLWEAWNWSIYDLVSTEEYVNLEMHPCVEALLTTWQHIQTVPGYRDSLEMSYIALENMHYDKQRYYWNWREHIPRSLITGNERGEGAIWAASFWVRRFQEGNHEEVAAILEEIKQHYEADEELPALIDAKRIAELEEKIAHEFRNGINPTVKDYVAKGADPGLLLGIDGITDLHIAVLADDIPRVSDLLSSTDISILDQFDCSPLVYARSTGMAEFLIEKGAVINDLETRYLPIEYFIMDRNVKLVKLLIEKGANVNLKNRQLHTALHRALPSGDTLTAEERKILEIMLEAGADPRIANRHGVSPLDVAREYNKYEVVKMFEEAILKLD